MQKEKVRTTVELIDLDGKKITAETALLFLNEVAGRILPASSFGVLKRLAIAEYAQVTFEGTQYAQQLEQSTPHQSDGGGAWGRYHALVQELGDAHNAEVQERLGEEVTAVEAIIYTVILTEHQMQYLERVAAEPSVVVLDERVSASLH